MNVNVIQISDTNTSYLFNVGGVGIVDGCSLMELKLQEHGYPGRSLCNSVFETWGFWRLFVIM